MMRHPRRTFSPSCLPNERFRKYDDWKLGQAYKNIVRIPLSTGISWNSFDAVLMSDKTSERDAFDYLTHLENDSLQDG